MEYDVECANSLTELIEVVSERLECGWRPQGGICTLCEPNGYTVFYQAIVKEEKSSKSRKKATKEDTDSI